MTVATLVTLAVPQASHYRAERERAVTPRLGSEEAVDAAQLRMVDPLLVSGRRWRGHVISRHFYAAGTSALTAPGVPSMPAAKEFYASPELVRVMASDPTVAALFDGWSRLGTIDTAGLIDPHELRAIAGVPPTEPFLRNVAGFGSDRPVGLAALSDNGSLNVVVAAFVTVLIWLPSIVLMVILARLASVQRQRRARALQLMGLSRTAVRAFHALETAVVAGPAALLGAVSFAVLTRRMTRVPGTNVGFFASDARLGWPAYLVAALSMTLIASLVTARSVRFGEVDEEHRATGGVIGLAGRRRSAPRLGWITLASGAGLLALMPVLVALSPVMLPALWLGCVMVAVGLALAGPSLVIRLFSTWSRTPRSGGQLVGMRLAGSHVSTSLRLGSLLSVLIVLCLGGQSFMSILNGGSPQAWTARSVKQAVVPMTVIDLAGGLTLARVHELAPASAVVQQRSARRVARVQQVPVVFAGCGHLHRLFQASTASCHDETPAWLSSSDATAGAPASRPVTEVAVAGQGRIKVPPPVAVIRSANLPSSLDGALRLPTRLAPSRSDGEGSLFYLLADSTRLTPTMARIASAAPTAQFDLAELDRRNPDRQQFPTQLQWLTLGAVTGLLVGVLALIATALGEIRERQLRMRTMRLLGSPARALFSAHLWSSAAPLVVLGWVATACGWLVCLAIRTIDDRAVVPSGTFAAVILGTVAAAALVSAATWPGVRRASSRSGMQGA